MRHGVWILPLLCAWIVTGCSRTATPLEPLARIGNAQISEEQFRRALARRAEVNTGPAFSAREKQTLLDELVTFEATYAQAVKAGFDRRPEVVEAIRRLIVTRFQEHMLESRFPRATVDEQEIRAAYEAQQARFSVAAVAEGAVLFIQANAKANDEKKAELRRHAESLRAQAAQASDEEFRSLVRQHSAHQATRYSGGRTGFLRRELTNATWEPEVVEASFSLSTPGETAPLVATERGFYIVRLLASKPGYVRPLAEVRAQIQARLSAEKEAERHRAFAAAMRDPLDIRINQARLDAISLPAADSGPPALAEVQAISILPQP